VREGGGTARPRGLKIFATAHSRLGASWYTKDGVFDRLWKWIPDVGLGPCLDLSPFRFGVETDFDGAREAGRTRSVPPLRVRGKVV
jgi:hypothetical protein